jgi:hypothetical protein
MPIVERLANFLKIRLNSKFNPFEIKNDKVIKVEKWFKSRPIFLANLKWQELDGTVNDYYSWDKRRKESLINIVKKYATGGDTHLDEAHPLADFVRRESDISIRTEWGQDVALNYFLAHVAHCIYTELFSVLPWNMSDLPDNQLAIILDGREYYDILPSGLYSINKYKAGGVTYGDPKRIFTFLQREGIIGATHRETIINILQWSSQNLVHFLNRPEYENAFIHWQYFGLPPVERIINGTIRMIYNERRVIEHHTLGCTGTTGFLRAVLRLLLIPVKFILNSRHGHSLPYFISIDKYLSHGDDPYEAIFRYGSNIPIELLLLDRSTYVEWFESAVDPTFNLSRRIAELALEYLPFYIMLEYCRDVNENKSEEESRIFGYFGNVYSLEYLYDQRLWERLGEKVTAFGGCDRVMAHYYEITTVK